MERRTKNEEQRTVSGLRAAFSLVEVTLALMVMAIGILSIMSLFPAGLDQNARSIADTHAAFFAEEVFAGLQARAETNWEGLADAQLPVAAPLMWSTTTNIHVTGNNVVTHKYEYASTTPTNKIFLNLQVSANNPDYAGNYLDPWGIPYVICMDANEDNKLFMPTNVLWSYAASNASGRQIGETNILFIIDFKANVDAGVASLGGTTNDISKWNTWTEMP